MARGVVVGVWRDDDFGEDVGDRLGGGGVERAVDGDDSAEGRNAVAGERLAPGVEQVVARGDAARVGVLDDDDGRRSVAKLGGQLERGVGVVQIVVAELLALDLFGLGDAARRRADRNIERGLLVRVLAVAQRHLQCAGAGPGRREALALVGESEPLRDGRIISCGQRERLRRELLAELERRAAARVELFDERGIVRGVGDNGDMGVVLGRRADHRRAADVDILDDRVAVGAAHDRSGNG